jgi:hypothetical protein
MTEGDLIELGFTKVDVLNSESDNGYDYYYYRLEVMPGITLVSCGNDELVNHEYYVINNDWTDIVITDPFSIVDLKNFAKRWLVSNS